jgi:t-SNARE complex subunit (syntaxin)
MHSASMMAERKRLRASLRTNHLGQFVSITEEVGQRRTTIVVPASAMAEFVQMLAGMAAQVGKEAPVDGVADSSSHAAGL